MLFQHFPRKKVLIFPFCLHLLCVLSLFFKTTSSRSVLRALHSGNRTALFQSGIQRTTESRLCPGFNKESPLFSLQLPLSTVGDITEASFSAASSTRLQTIETIVVHETERRCLVHLFAKLRHLTATIIHCSYI